VPGAAHDLVDAEPGHREPRDAGVAPRSEVRLDVRLRRRVQLRAVDARELQVIAEQRREMIDRRLPAVP
jgi:hypothetical protein